MNKILHVVPALAAGGIENLLLNYSIEGPIYDNFQIDFITHAKTGLIHETLLERGFSVFYVTPKKVSLIKNLKETAKVIKNGNYDIVHVHQTYSSFLALLIAKIYKVPVRIVHSHTNVKSQESLMKKILNAVMRYFCCIFSTDLWACGQAAGKYLYGKKKKFFVMPNAVSGEKLIKDRGNDKKNILNKLNVNEDDIIVSQIGRFTFEKNHAFTIEVMKKFTENDLKYVFVFAGDGPLKNDIMKKIDEHGLLSKCRFLGNIDYVHELLSVTSVALLPSLFEGFPVTVIESLFNGTPILCSNNISEEVELFHLCTRMEVDPDLWREKILLESKIDEKEKEKCSMYMMSSMFEINNARKLIYEKYQSILEKKKNTL